MGSRKLGIMANPNASNSIGYEARPSTRMTTSAKAPQTKISGPDKWDTTTFRCSRHDIDYRMKGVRPGQQPVCPLCEEMSLSAHLREEMKKLANANDVLKKDRTRLSAQLSCLDGMREAVSELDDEDMQFLKEMLYRYKADPGRVRVTQLLDRRKVRSENGMAYRDDVVGWTVIYTEPGTNASEAQSHKAGSVGGRMMALQFSESLKVSGLKSAMQNLNKALHATMANS